ncbi:guanine nucleotide-binding protein subunit alpha-11-like [Musca autumnalis]|uniref:guanine nucleotide-binding protein subunit alpha-11-like n=1 Tax=Musca autumnalis TaxID=221902 RepID=UPI003CF84C19
MLCSSCCSGEADIHSKRIDEILERDARKESSKIKLLLLGAGESGKSTFIRQMQIIYKDGFSEKTRRAYSLSIKENILDAMQTMLRAMSTLNIDFELQMNKRNAELIMSADYETFASSLEMHILAIKELWYDAGIQECYRNRNQYQLIDSARYYVENIDRIAKPSYLPTDDDILHVRIRTTGLIDHFFTVDTVVFQMTDVGGQRSERRKWLHCFDSVKAIIFLTAISEYDQVLREDEQQNRLIESKLLFQKITDSKWFIDTSVVVFFNKIDVLEEKIKYSDLRRYFPEYDGPHQDHITAREFIANMFLDEMSVRKLYKHFTCATDTSNIRVVFVVVRNAILSQRLTDTGVL